MEDYLQANQAKYHLNNLTLYDSVISINKSKINEIFILSKPRNQMTKTEKEEDFLQKDFSNSNEHRYKVAWSKNFQNIASPNETLHVSNLPLECSEADLKSHFSSSSEIEIKEIRLFETGGKKMAYVQCLSISDAVTVIIKFHNSSLSLSKTTHPRKLKISFSKV